MNATLRPDGSFAGMSKFRGGDYPFKVEKGAAVAVATAPAAAPVTTYDGKWSGYAINSGDCVKGEYDIEIKGGKISGTVSFFLRPIACTSTVSGEVGADGTGALRLVKQVPECRSSRFAGKFDGNEFKASDSSAGGRCPYDVTLKKKN